MWSKNKPKRFEYYLIIQSKECVSQIGICITNCALIQKIFRVKALQISVQNQNFDAMVILTKVNPNLVDILEILKFDTHLSTNLRNCP